MTPPSMQVAGREVAIEDGPPDVLDDDQHPTIGAVDPELHAIAEHLASRRGDILLAWQNAIFSDALLTTARAHTRGQLNDHIPQVLDAFEDKLRSRPGGPQAQSADHVKTRAEVKHGMHRWQQGYQLPELVREWGHLRYCLLHELNTFAAAHPEVGRDAIAHASSEMICLVNESVYESCKQFHRMLQAEAHGRVGDIEVALANLKEIERRRASLIREVVHDLNGNVLGVRIAAKLLCTDDVPESERQRFSLLLQQGIQTVTSMLSDMTELARLESGKETPTISEFDASALLKELSDVHRPFAESRGLFLKVEGPARLAVDSDPCKLRRLLQNLLLNALKYTEQGGVVLSLGSEEENGWLMIKDTGPGLQAGANAPLIVGMQEATASARESDEHAAAIEGETSQVLVPPPGGSSALQPSLSHPGEGIGLTIVKRLCELLDASLEVSSSPNTGTTFRVVLPRHKMLRPSTTTGGSP